MARPSSYKKEYAEQAYRLCLLGATDADIADFFGVTERTINNWKTRHKEFFQSLKEGKLAADARVAERLFQRALGYSHPEDRIFNNNGVPLVVPTTKHYPPDPTSAIFWLKNRQPERWREKPEADGNDDAPAPVKVEVAVVDARKPDADA